MSLPPHKSLASTAEPGNRKFHRTICPLVAVVFLVPAGCAAQRKTAPPRSEYILAARYDFEGQAAASKQDASARLPQSLQQFQSLGFNAVVLDYLPDHERQNLLAAAGQLGLRAYLTDRDLHYFLLTGKLRGTDSLERLIVARVAPLAAQPAYAGVAILSGYPADRVSEVTAALQAARIAYLLPGQGRYKAGGGSVVAWLDANSATNSGISQIEQLLLEFNAELFAGWNDGVVIDFAPESGKAAAAAEPTADEELESEPTVIRASGTKSKVFAVESLLLRANRWGRRLRGFERLPVMNAGVHADPALQIAVFVRDSRRYLFLFNQSSQPVRGPVRVPGVLANQSVIRAVEIPATRDRLVGSVFETRGGEIALHVMLRPGDAALFELF